MAGDVQIMESTGKNTRRERNRRTPVQPPKKEHKISLMKVGISFLIVIALVLGSVSVVTVIKNREIHLSNLYDKSNAVFGIEKVQFNANRAAAFSENLCVPDGTEDDSSLNLTSGAAGSFDLASGEVDYAQNIFNKMYPASITKVLTSLIALKYGNLSDKVTFSNDCISFMQPGDSSVGLKEGNVISLEQALYATLLASANEAAYAVAENVGKNAGHDYNWFIQQMNEECKSLGGNNSNFVNANGLHDDNHYTCARDMALIGREIWRYPEFLKICQEQSYTIPASDTTEEHVFPQHHKMLIKENKNYYQYAVAGKTGYTSNALSTLITMADNGNMKLVCVVLRTHGANIYPDTKNLFEYVFNNFQKIPVADEKKPDEVEKFISAADSQSDVSAQSDGSEDTESVQTGGNEYQPLEDGHVILPKDVSYKDIDYEITDVDEDTGEGTIRYIYDGHQVGSATAEFTDKYLQKVSTRKERVDSKQKDVDNSGDSKKNGGKSSAKSIWKNFLQKVEAVWDFGQKKFAGKSSTEKYMIAGGCVALVILIFSLIVLLIRRRR